MTFDPARSDLPHVQRRVHHALALACCGVFTSILALYVGLIPLGHWQDEYSAFPELISGGFKQFLWRLSTWSPRPVSELFIFGYAHAVERYQTALIAPALAILWTALLLSNLLPVFFRERSTDRIDSPRIVLLALAMLCLFFLGHTVSEFFYWPQGAAAYIPTIAAICTVVWVTILRSITRATSMLSVAMLTIAAWSAEVGAIFTVLFCTSLFVLRGLDRRQGRPAENPALYIYWVPLIAAAAVLIVVKMGRGNVLEITGDPTVAHHFGRSLRLSLAAFIRTLLTADGGSLNLENVVVGMGAKVLFFLGACVVLAPQARRGSSRAQTLASLCAACFGVVFATIALGYWKFGWLCCERHDTFRQCMVYIGLLCGAALTTGTAPRWLHRLNPKSPSALEIFLLAGAVLLPALVSIPKVVSQYQFFDRYREVSRANWSAGKARTEHLEYGVLPRGAIVGGVGLPSGTYRQSPESGWLINSILEYFRKETVTFRNQAVTVSKPSTEPPVWAPRLLQQPRPICNLDRVNELPYQDQPIAIGAKELTLQGWTAPQEVRSAAIRTYVVVGTRSGEKAYFATNIEERPDVATALKNSRLGQAGFHVTLDLSEVQGAATLLLVSTAGGQAYECDLKIALR